MRGYPVYGAVVFGFLIMLCWWRVRAVPARTGAVIWVFTAAAAAFAAGQLFVAPRARPSLHNVQQGVSVLYHPVSGFPPPSGTAAMAGAVAAGLFLVSRRLGVTAAVTAVITALFQICVVAYSWQDVVAGLIFGVAIVLGGYAVLEDALTLVGGFVAIGPLRRHRRPAVPGAGEHRQPAR